MSLSILRCVFACAPALVPVDSPNTPALNEPLPTPCIPDPFFEKHVPSTPSPKPVAWIEAPDTPAPCGLEA